MRVRRSESRFYGEPGGPDRRATARLRREWAAPHARPAVDPTETALTLMPPPVEFKGFCCPRISNSTSKFCIDFSAFLIAGIIVSLNSSTEIALISFAETVQ